MFISLKAHVLSFNKQTAMSTVGKKFEVDVHDLHLACRTTNFCSFLPSRVFDWKHPNLKQFI